MRFSERVVDLQGFDRGRLRLRKAIFRRNVGIDGKRSICFRKPEVG